MKRLPLPRGLTAALGGLGFGDEGTPGRPPKGNELNNERFLPAEGLAHRGHRRDYAGNHRMVDPTFP